MKAFRKIGEVAIENDDYILLREVFGCLSEVGMRGGGVRRDLRIASQAFYSLKALIENIEKKRDEYKEKLKEIDLAIKIGLKDVFVLGARCYHGPGTTKYYEGEYVPYSLGDDFRIFLGKHNPEDILKFTISIEDEYKSWTDFRSSGFRYFGENPKGKFKDFYENEFK
jgi:hypothetical protein